MKITKNNYLQTLSMMAVLLHTHQSYATDATDATMLAELSLESLTTMSVSTASRFIQPMNEAPAVITVINRQQIKQQGWQTLADVVNALPGFTRAADGVYPYVGTRGMFIPGDFHVRFLLQIDGIRLNDNIFQQAMLGAEFPVDIALIERIEYLSGPSSSVYGANAMFGVINVVTRKGQQLANKELNMEVSSTSASKVSLLSKHRTPSGNVVTAAVSGSYIAPQDVEFRDEFGQLTYLPMAKQDAIAYDRGNLSSKRAFLRYENDGLYALAYYGSRTVFPANTPYNTVFNADPKQKVIDDLWRVALGYNEVITSDIQLNTSLAIAGYHYDATNPYFDNSTSNFYLARYDSSGVWGMGNANILYNIAAHKVVAGLEFQQDIRASQRNYALDGSIPELDIDTNKHNYSFYIQDEWYWQQILLSGGVRWDTNSEGDSVLSPRASAIIPLAEHWQAKLLFGSAFRPANDYERNYTDYVDYLSNPHLQPEKFKSYELVLEYYRGRDHWRVSVFRQMLNDVITLQSTASNQLQFQNGSLSNTTGAELYWHKSLGGQRYVSGSFMWPSKAHNSEASDGLYGPKSVLKIQAATPFTNTQWWLAINGEYIDKGTYDWRENRVDIKAKAIINVNLTKKSTSSNTDVYLRVNNVLNTKVFMPATQEVPMPTMPSQKRTITLGLQYAL